MAEELKYNAREITHGTHHVTYTDLKGTKSELATGVTKFSVESEQESTPLYADGQIHMTLYNDEKITITQSNYQLSDLERNQSGEVIYADGVFASGGAKEGFNVQRLLKRKVTGGEDTLVLDAYFNVTSSNWKESDDEDEESIAAKQYERTLTVEGTDFNGKRWSHMHVERTEKNKDVFDLYKTKVLTPDDFKELVGKWTAVPKSKVAPVIKSVPKTEKVLEEPELGDLKE